MLIPPKTSVVYRALGAMALVLGFCQGRGHAHANAGVDAIDVVANGLDAPAGLESTVGYIRRLPAGDYEWLCHETVTQLGALITPRYVENAEGTVLATVGVLEQARNPSESVYWSVDGCDWFAPTGLTGHRVAAVSFDPNRPSTAIAVTATTGQTNGIHMSTDSGRTWFEVAALETGWSFTSIVHADGPASSIWAVAVQADPPKAALHRSTDGGASWVRSAIELGPPIDELGTVRVLIADQNDSAAAWLVAGPFLDNALIRTRDAGETFTTVYRAMAEVIDGTQDTHGGIWLVLSGNKVMHSTDGDTFRRLADAPLSLGVGAAGDDVLLATRVPSEGTALSVCRSAEHCAPQPTFTTLQGPPECPESSDSARLCEPLWPDLAATVLGTEDTGDSVPRETDDTAAGVGPSAKGCCSSSGPTNSVAFLALPFLWRKRSSGPTPKRTPPRLDRGGV